MVINNKSQHQKIVCVASYIGSGDDATLSDIFFFRKGIGKMNGKASKKSGANTFLNDKKIMGYYFNINFH
jgi:hypothetical protein